MNNLNLPAVTADEMREVDRLMMEEYAISLEQMMENAGRNLADLAVEILGERLEESNGKRVAVACGPGNNGGGGMVAARFLSSRGFHVSVVLAGKESSLKAIPAKRWRTLRKLPARTIVAQEGDLLSVFQEAHLIIDAIIGYGLHGEPQGIPAQVIGRILDSAKAAVLSLDVPSGLDSTTGAAAGICVRAQATMTLALPKTGLLKRGAEEYVGDLYLADIGVPPNLYARLGLAAVNLFSEESIVRVR